MQKLRHYDQIHGRQADVVSAVLRKSEYPLVVSGDFNSVPSSYAYHTIKGELHDAFLQKGLGLGRTYADISPTLRIDYIFADKSLKVRQYQSPHLYLSDHFPVVADLSWK
jgi:endonuclease/exonuclease/phosphatase family metal-dependent hydrolase